MTAAAMALAAASLQAQVVPPLVVEYRDKPPYSYTEAGQASGFLIERTVKLLDRARIEARFAEVPIRRTLNNLQANQSAICSPGLYKIPEREAFARYSMPIHRDRPHVVLAHASAVPRIRGLTRLSSLFADPTLVLGVLDGASYGVELDQAIAGAARAPVRAQITPLQLARMVGAKRVDYMLIDDEDLGWLRRDPSFAPMELVRIAFADMPRGQLRYIACSLKFDLAQMERLNQAIRELLPELQIE